MGDYLRALEDLSAALNVKPHYCRALVYRAKSNFALKRRSDALNDLRLALSLDAREARGWAGEVGIPQATLTMLEEHSR
ncbi:MAG: hypothetical protein AAGE52_22310 [Myxococcota bacterium]